MHRAFLLLTLGLAITTGCKSGMASSDDSGDGGSAAGTGGGDGGGGDGESPYILEMDAWCFQHTTGDKFYQWIIDIEADDPQGADTIDRGLMNDAVIIYDNGGTELATYPLVCQEGECTSSFKETDDNIACSTADSYTITGAVVDEEDNWSDWTEVIGRQGTDASGR